MANSSAATDTARRARNPGDVARAAALDYVDLGQPVDNLPPLEEFGFDEPAGTEPVEAAPATIEPVPEIVGGAPAAATDEDPAPADGLTQVGEEPAGANVSAAPPRFENAAPAVAVVAPLAHEAVAVSTAAESPVEGKTVEVSRSPAGAGRLPAFAAMPAPIASAAASAGSAPTGAAGQVRSRSSPGRAARWWTWPKHRRGRLALAAGAAAMFIATAAIVAGLGPLSLRHDYRTAQPPGDPVQRFAFYQVGAKSGDANAELQLAILYAKGEGVAQDYAAAATWFRAAADQGIARAQYDLGVLYERGRGVPVDLNEAANWYAKAAAARYPLAEYNLAVCYTKGQGIRQDLPEAALWYRRAAGHGVVQAMINLGMMYEKADGIAASPVDAYAWYVAAGQRGNQPAAQRAQELFASLPRLDQIRAEALAGDVAASIHNPQQEPGDAAAEKPQDAKPNATDR